MNTSFESAAAFTVIAVCAPVMVLVTVSVAVIVWSAAVFNVTPFVNV